MKTNCKTVYTKKTLKKVTVLFTALCLVFLSAGILTSCSESDEREVAMSLDTYSVSEGMYAYWVSTYKDYILYSINGAEDDESFWGRDIGTGVSFGEYCNGNVKDTVKNTLCALKLFDSFGLSLNEKAHEEITQRYNDAILGYDSQQDFEKALAELNLDEEELIEIYTVEQKLTALDDFLFASGGELEPTDEDRQAYYENNYLRAKILLIDTSMDTESALLLADSIVKAYNDGIASFEELYDEYNTDVGAEEYYINKRDTMTYPEELIGSIIKTEVDGLCTVNTDGKVFVVKRLALEDKAYSLEENKDVFINFESYVISEKYGILFDSVSDGVKVNERVTDRIKIEEAPKVYF